MPSEPSHLPPPDPPPTVPDLRSFEAYRALFERCPLPMWLYEVASLRILMVNAAAVAKYGYSQAEFAQMTLYDLRPVQTHDELTGYIASRPREGPHQLVTRHRVKDGRLIDVEVTGQALGPEFPGVRVTIALDATERREAERAEQARQAAEASSRMKTEFMSRLSHEMRTPLNAMLGFAQLMSLQYTTGRRADDQTQLGYANHILQAGRHLLSLVNDVLEVQQMDQGRLAFTLVPVDLAEAARSTMAFLAPLAAAHEVGLQMELPPGVLAMADEVRLRQVMLNLASNAIKYNRRGGRVQWALRSGREGFVTLLIRDEGPGISTEHQASLFQPFQRLGKEASAIEGTGLGLVVSRGLVEQMGGRLTIESEPGQGTQAVVELPRPAEDGVAAVVAAGVGAVGIPPAEVPLGARPRRLLYVEDNRLNAMLFEAAFGDQPDIELRIAADGAEALRCVETWTPDLLAIDAQLPDTTGLQLLSDLRQRPELAATPAWMCSAAAMPEDLEKARTAGFRGYWTKPVDIARILADIRAVTPLAPVTR